MRLSAAIATLNDTDIAIVLVDSAFTVDPAGTVLLHSLRPHFPTLPVMIVSIERNGFRAFATFQTAQLLAILQLEELTFVKFNVSCPPEDTTAPPF